MSELSRTPGPRRRWLAAAIAIAATTTVALVGSTRADPCPPADHPLAGICHTDARRPPPAPFHANGTDGQ